MHHKLYTIIILVNINKYKKSYAKLIADEFELEYRGKITMSETQICLIILMIITFYQMLITLFAPCFGNVFILLLEYIALICLSFWLIFGC